MSDIDLQVLRAVARLSRMRRVVDCETLVLRAGGSEEDVRASLGRLTRAGLVDRQPRSQTPRLTMAGLAMAVASGAAVVRKRKTHAPMRRAA